MRSKIFFLISSFLVAIIIILVGAIALLENMTVSKLSINNMKQNQNDKVLFFNEYVKRNKNSLNLVSNNKRFLDFVIEKNNKEFIIELFKTVVKSNKDIFQLRFINNQGDEIIRVEQLDEVVKVVDTTKLQNKKNRYYFLDTIRMDKGKIYFSNIDLNVEHGKIQKPIVPTIRLATPIIIDNKKLGIVILNINVGQLLDTLVQSPLHNIALIYDDGSIIVHNEKKYNWSRDFQLAKNVFDIAPLLPRNYNEKKFIFDENYYISKLDIETKDNMYLLITPKNFTNQISIRQNIEKMIYFLIALAVLGIPIGFVIASYIDGLYNDREKYKKTKIEQILLNSVVNSTNDLIFYKDKEFKYIGCNEAFEKFVGKTHDEIVGKSDFELFDNELASLFRIMDIKMLDEYNTRVNDEWVNYPDGSKRYLHTQKTPFYYDDSGDIGILGFSRDITKLYEAQEKIKHQTYIDELTGAFNRKAYNEKVQEKLDLFKRYDAPFCLAMFDIDDFKSINDNYGHDRGDIVLQSISKRVKNTIRKTDILFRVGGEEFIILFPKTKLDNAYYATKKVLENVEALDLIKDRKVTISIGLTQIAKTDSSESIYQRVDKLLYTSKNNGKNTITKL